MKLIKAESSDFSKIVSFYKYVINNTENMAEYGRWIYGQHPTDEIINGYIEGGYMYYTEDNGEITSAVAVTPYQSADYHPVQWSVEAGDDEVSVVHILCIDPKRQKCGLAKSVMYKIISMAKEDSKKAVRLDALCCNIPAHRLYESIGFKKRGCQKWYADNTGWIDFFLYEFVC
ncbi:MAG: GNAT family N-acetyltransferase [Oscillospiraceae bacterium]|nr:GNAT family N-acetyltransferase [Oscillospiraceae bacterium]